MKILTWSEARGSKRKDYNSGPVNGLIYTGDGSSVWDELGKER